MNNSEGYLLNTFND